MQSTLVRGGWRAWWRCVMRSGLSLLCLSAGTLVLGAMPATGHITARGCPGSALGGSFTHVPGSDAMGHAEFVLWLTNRSSQTCTVMGRPALQLLGRGGKLLPTDATAWRSARAVSPVTLGPGGSAEAVALVAVDIPGRGDVHRLGAACQPTSVGLRVGSAGNTSTDVPVQPPTPICASGSIARMPLVALTPVMPSGLLAMLKTLLHSFPPLEYTLKVRYDPEDSSWVEWSWAAAGPAYSIQGGYGFAHLMNGRWRNVWGPGPTGFCPSAAVSRAVVRALGVSCVSP